MPLLKGRTLAPAKPVVSMGPTDTVYVIPHTGEQFLSKEEFEKRQALYKECVWTCQCTGAIKLTHKEAMESEKKVRQLLAKEFPLIFEEQVIQLVHNSSISLDNLVDEAWRNIHEFITVGEPVTLKVKAHGKIMRGTIVKIDQTTTYQQPVGEDGESMKSKQVEAGGDSPRKPPKLHPCKYGVLIEGEDKIINCIPSSDLVRETKLPKKDVIRFFIRSHAVRSGNQPPDNPWIVDEEIISKYSLQNKTFASGDNQESQGKRNAESSAKRKAKSHSDENCIPSKKIKFGSKSKPESKKKNKVMADNQKKLSKSNSFFGSVGLSKMNNNKKSEEGNSAEILIKTDSKDSKTLKTTLKSPGKIASFVNGFKRSNSVSSTSSSCEVPLSKLREQIHDGSGQMSIVAGGDVLEQSLNTAVGKKKSVGDVDQINSGESDTKDTLRNEELSDDDGGNSIDLPLAKLRELSHKDEKDGRCATSGMSVSGGDKTKLVKAKASTGRNSSISTSPKSNPSKNSITSSSKKQLKQMTLFDMKGRQKEKNALDVKSMSQKNPEKCSSPSTSGSAKKTPKELVIKIASVSESPKDKSVQKNQKAAVKETPHKSSEPRNKKVASPVPTPSRSLPPIVLRLQKVKKESNAHLYAMLLARCARELSDKQVQGLPDSLRSVILPKFNKLKEKKRLETMTPAEREAHMLKKKEELRQKLKNKFAESRRRYEDTDLDLMPLPSPKLVPTPDGLANELFGDVAMVAEFISSFSGLLMPSDSSDITSEKLMMALVAGKEGFSYLSRVLCILLQTLLQDKLAEEYKELRVPLSEIPISEHTASELVRLCLRRFDAQLEDADICSSTDDEESKLSEDNEVSEVLIEQLETSEFYELEVEAKVQILVGLSNRIMGSYSVQDYMDEKQQEASELWKRRIAELKEKNDKRKSDKGKVKKSGSDSKKLGDDAEKSESTKGTGLTIDHFYGEKNGESKPTTVNSSNEQLDEEEDMLSAIKRRRKAAEERKQKEAEERLRKEKERTEMLQIKEGQIFENQFKKGIALAKNVVRHSPVGLDRNHDRYWILCGSRAGLYVEKGWASQDAEYTVQLDLSSSCESDSDGRSMESGIQSGSSDRVKGIHVEKTIPHIGQNLWFLFDSVEEINLLMDSLHPLGVRESSLKESLKKNYDCLVKRLNSSSSKVTEVSDHFGGNERLVQGLREEMRDLQLRLIHGGLGGVTSLPDWEKKLSAASEMKEFVECLTDVQLHVLPKFMKGLLAANDTPKKKKTDDSEDKNRVEEDEIKVDEKKDADGLKLWLDALNHCSTISRLHVLMGIFESCIKWEKSAENMKCRICRKKGDEEYLLLCDECNMPFHLFCLRPVLLEIPVGEWYCPACSPERSSPTSRSKIHVRKEIEDLEEDEGIADTEHEQECAICGDDGDLIQCSTCPSSFHMDCHDPPLRHMPRTNTWKCMQCKTGVRIRKSRRNRGQKRKHYIDYMTEESELEEPPVQGRKLRKASTVSDLKRKDVLQSSGDASSHRRHEDDVEPTVPRTRSSDSSKPVVSASRSKSNRQTVTKGEPSPEIFSAKRTSGIPEVQVVVTKLDRYVDGKSSRNPSTSRDKVDKQMILDLIDRLRKHRLSWPFLEPVDVEDAPDYYTIITNPVDLRTMEDKCISDVYSKPQQFIADFTLMLQNAERYNEEDSVVGKCIAPLDKFFEGIVGRYIPESRYQSCQWFISRRS